MANVQYNTDITVTMDSGHVQYNTDITVVNFMLTSHLIFGTEMNIVQNYTLQFYFEEWRQQTRDVKTGHKTGCTNTNTKNTNTWLLKTIVRRDPQLFMT